MSTTAKNKNIGIQYLRAICAIIVYFSHYFKAVDWAPINAFRLTRWSFIVDGAIAVAIFFTISGFFYYNTRQLTMSSYFKGLERKALHIYPVHIVVLFIGLLLANFHIHWDTAHFTNWGNKFWVNHITFSDFIKSATCIFIADAENQINPSAWYLEYEVLLFVIMPLLVGGANKIGWKYSWSILFVGILALLIDLPMYNLLNVIVVCCMGTLAHYIVQKYELNFLHNKSILLLWIGVAIFFLAHVYFGMGKIYMPLRGIGAAMLVMAVWKLDLSNIKKFKGLEFLGNISFEFYLVQHIALLALRPLFVNSLVYLFSTLSCTILFAWLLNRYVTQRIVSHK